MQESRYRRFSIVQQFLSRLKELGQGDLYHSIREKLPSSFNLFANLPKKCYHKKNYAYFNLVYSICHRVNIYMLVVLFAGTQRTFTILHFLTIKALLKRYSVNVYIFIRYPKFSIVPFDNNDKLFKGSNALLKLPHTHPLCYTFLIKKPSK